MINNKLSKKSIYVVAIILSFLLIFLIFISTRKINENALTTLSINEANQLRNENEISEETFDKYGNLTHYKYKKEYDIDYTFDTLERITKVSYDNNYISIEYNNDNKISKLINQIQDNQNSKKIYEYLFTYDESTIKVSSAKSYISDNVEENYTSYENYIITEKIINKEKYSLCKIIEEKYGTEQQYFYKIENKEINYSNIFSLLNIDFVGYISFEPTIKHTNFTIELPIFNAKNIVYFKDLSLNNRNDFSYNNYYDINDNILKFEMFGTNQAFYNEIYYIYEEINNTEYYSYCLSMYGNTDNISYTYIKEKKYLNENNIIYKIETLENKNLSEEQYNKELGEFKKYFEKNKI